MANQDQLARLRQGVTQWNTWRKKHPEAECNLSGADLRGADLRHADLSDTDLSDTDLREADLSEADLHEAYLTRAKLYRANLIKANLRKAHLTRAILYGADLREADLREVDLSEAGLSEVNLSRASLSGAIFSRTKIGWTTFTDLDLRDVKELETIVHRGPSSIGIDTLYRSQGNIPEAFLKGAGVDDTFITYIRSLVGRPIEYYTCFISYSSKDEAFARRLHADLQSHNVRCWFAPEDLKIGAVTREGIDEAIHLHDKLLLILSRHSVASGWVEHEVKSALAREKKEKRIVLFPVRLDNAVFGCPYDWATEIRHERNIGDFTRWKDYDEYQKVLNRLLHDLKAGG